MLFGLAKYIAPANATHAAIMPTVPSNACSPSGKDPVKTFPERGKTNVNFFEDGMAPKQPKPTGAHANTTTRAAKQMPAHYLLPPKSTATLRPGGGAAETRRP